MPRRTEEERDPAVSAYLALLARDMAAHPERVEAVTEGEVRRLRWLTDNVEACDDDVIPGDVMF